MRLATTTSMFAGVALFTLLSYAIVPANAAVADPSAAVKWQPVNDGWDAITIATLEAAFSAGRNGDASVPDGKKAFKVGVDQDKWKAMDPQARALHVLNLERTDRGLRPVSAIVNPLKTIAQDYAEFLQAKAAPDGADGLKNTADQAAWTSSGRSAGTCCTYEARLSAQPSVADARDGGFAFGEALVWASITDAAKMTDPFTWALYNWIYDDVDAEWGHRKFAFATYDQATGNGHGGTAEAEGLVGFGSKIGSRGTYVVMNAIDQNKAWNHCADSFRYDGVIPPCAGAPVPPGANNTANPPKNPVSPETGNPPGAPATPVAPDTNDGERTPSAPRSPTYEYPCDEGEKEGEMDNLQVFVMTAAFLMPIGFIFGAYYVITLCQVARLDLEGAMSEEILNFTGYAQKPKGKKKGKKPPPKKKGKDVEAGKKKAKKAASSSSSSSSSDSDSDSDSSSDSD